MAKGLMKTLLKGNPPQRGIHNLTIPITNLAVTVTSVSTAVGFGSAVIRGLPENNILFLGAVSYVSLAGTGADANLTATWNGDYSIGSAPTADVTLSGSEVDIIPSTAVGPAVAEVSPSTRGANATQVFWDNTGGTLEMNLNVLVDAADIGDDQSVVLTANGYINIAYITM